ncbi:MAG: heparinase II/III family protein [Flavobacteriales bacterium]|nr:heparinase II/III family protein [Flavobacteriales bacterium]
MNRFNLLIVLILSILLGACQEKEEQSTKLERPFIWVKASEKEAILNKIENNVWAAKMFKILSKRTDKTLSNSLEERAEKLKVLPLVWLGDSSLPPTIKVYSTETPWDRSWTKAEGIGELTQALTEAVDNAVMYYLTEDDQYAEAAGDVLATVVNGIGQMSISDERPNNRGLILQQGHLSECRIYGAKIPIIYDFIYPWLKAGGKVYDVANKDLRPFDFEAAQATFRIYIELAKGSGHLGSNWSVLESPSLLGNTLALEDETERKEQLAYYLNKDTERQESLATVAKRYEKSGDTWPESLSYSTHVVNITTGLMTILDGVYPDINLGDKYSNIPAALNVYYSLQFPNEDYPSFGDSKRHMHLDYLWFDAALRMAKLNNNEAQIKTLSEALSYVISTGKYNRSKLGKNHESTLKLLWSNEGLGDKEKMDEPIRDRTNHLPHAGLYVQRNISSANKIKNSLMGTLSGAGYVHSHASGIDMELYGQGYVLGTEGGKGQYGTAIHENYYKIFAAHNSVVSNGASGSKGPWVELGIETVVASAMEPNPTEEAVSPNHSFVTVEWFDKHNLIKEANHQRTLALIKLSETHGFYLDIFRAKSDTSIQYHDYMYHNIGEKVEISSNGTPLSLTDDSTRYSASGEIVWERQDVYQFPGWHYFEEVKSSKSSSNSMEAIFSANQLSEQPINMRALIPAGLETEITKVMAPKSHCAPKPYDTLQIPTFILRHKGETWKNPFAVVYESYSAEPVVQSVERLMQDGIFKGVEVVSKIEGKTIRQYIILQESIEDEYVNNELQFSFKGQFGLITFDDKYNVTEMYIGKGQNLSYQKDLLRADKTTQAGYLKK